MKDFRTLSVWEKSHQLVLALYKLTKPFPKEEIYGLTSQIRRATTSIPANIAEGCGKDSDLDFARYLQNAMGSASELEYHLLLARDLLYLDEANYSSLAQNVVEIKRMLAAFIQKLRQKR